MRLSTGEERALGYWSTADGAVDVTVCWILWAYTEKSKLVLNALYVICTNSKGTGHTWVV